MGLWMVLRDLQQWMDTDRRDGLFGNHNHKNRARLLRGMRAAPELAPALRAFLHLRSNPGSIPAS